MNRATKEGIVETGKEARVKGVDRLAMRAIWFPCGIVRDAVILASQGKYDKPQRTVVQEFRNLDAMY